MCQHCHYWIAPLWLVWTWTFVFGQYTQGCFIHFRAKGSRVPFSFPQCRFRILSARGMWGLNSMFLLTAKAANQSYPYLMVLRLDQLGILQCSWAIPIKVYLSPGLLHSPVDDFACANRMLGCWESGRTTLLRLGGICHTNSCGLAWPWGRHSVYIRAGCYCGTVLLTRLGWSIASGRIRLCVRSECCSDCVR
jgi:hypothetical protein